MYTFWRLVKPNAGGYTQDDPGVVESRPRATRGKGCGAPSVFQKSKKNQDSISWNILSNVLFSVVPSVRSETVFISSEQQKMGFAAEQQSKYKNPGKNVKVI